MRKLKISNRRLFWALVIGAVLATLSLVLPIPRLKIVPTQAEIATQGDWIGLFPVEDDDPLDILPIKNSIADTYGGSSWMWAGDSSDPNTCRANPFLPHLSGSCSPFSNNLHSPTGAWTLPTGGAYEFRLYGNRDSTAPTTEQVPSALLAQSKVFWGTMQVTATCRKSMTGTYSITVFWPSGLLSGKGVSSFDLLRNGVTLPFPGDSGFYNDTNVATNSAYIYSIKEYSIGNKLDKTGKDNHTFDSPSIPVNDSNCTPAWLKTSGGDVHTNR